MDLSQRMLDRLEAAGLGHDAMLHSDRGSIHTAIAYRDRLKHMGVVQSMSRSGNCRDNACIERFFGYMRDKLGIRKNGKAELMGYSKMKRTIADWVEECPHMCWTVCRQLSIGRGCYTRPRNVSNKNGASSCCSSL
jgi:transposase InsO family protein